MKRLSTLSLFLLMLASAALIPAAVAATAPTHVAPGHATDAQLESTIRAKLAKSKIGKDGFKFHVLHGTVTWEGTTSVSQHKGAATRMARTSGASQVINNIHVSGAEKPGTPMKRAYVQP
jgi:hypothetical protein